MHPDFGEASEWRRKWLNWEATIRQNASLVSGALSDEVRISVVRQRAPDELKRHLVLMARDYGSSYEQFRSIIEGYWTALEPAERDKMDWQLEFVETKRPSKGGDSGSRQTAGGGPRCFHCGFRGHVVRECDEKARGQAPRCYWCGKSGHYAKECFSKDKGKGKGKEKGDKCKGKGKGERDRQKSTPVKLGGPGRVGERQVHAFEQIEE